MSVFLVCACILSSIFSFPFGHVISTGPFQREGPSANLGRFKPFLGIIIKIWALKSQRNRLPADSLLVVLEGKQP